jgi:hypothetical protein
LTPNPASDTFQAMSPSQFPPGEVLFRNEHTVLKQCRHGFFLFNSNDSFIGRSLDLYGEWCEAEGLLPLLGPGQVVVDVGANIGTHTIPFANKVTKTGLVVAFEPQRQVFNYLVSNLTLKNLLHVATFQSALGEASG